MMQNYRNVLAVSVGFEPDLLFWSGRLRFDANGHLEFQGWL